MAGYLDTLAAAHAEAGDFNEAVKYEKKVIELGIEDKETEREVFKRLKLYEEGKPFRDQ
jgi:serine/threonine-protein kinase